MSHLHKEPVPHLDTARSEPLASKIVYGPV
jgi:hypothetical protein